MRHYSIPMSVTLGRFRASRCSAVLGRICVEESFLLQPCSQRLPASSFARYSSATSTPSWLPVAPSARCNSVTSKPGSGGDGSTPDDRGDVCRLFHEIGGRVAVAARDRLSAASSPSGGDSTRGKRQSAASLTSEFCKAYLSLPDDQPTSRGKGLKQEFIELLTNDGVDEQSLVSAIDDIRSHSLRGTDIRRLRELCTPRYESAFLYILGSAQQDLGVAFLVKLRRDVRDTVRYLKFTQHEAQGDKENDQHQLAKLQALERNIQTILTSLFRPGVLSLQRITYHDTPAAIIEQIAFKEAVHPMQSLDDLRRRLGPGRRCFAFFHPALPHQPLVFVHVALLKDLPSSMDDLQYASESDATCATFYSITNTEPGLAGVDLGNHLIKSVVQVLREEFPQLHTFCTLSPIPSFRKWLEGKIAHYHEGSPSKFTDDDLFSPAELQQLQDIFSSESHLHDLSETLKSPDWHKNSDGSASALFDQLQPLLMKLASYHLTVEKHHGRPICPVAKFHVRNGSEMFRLNYAADKSPKGMRQSCGMMINYQYVLDEIEENRVQYELSGDVKVREQVKSCLGATGSDV